jgi:type II secretory pathway component PulL
VRCGNDEKLFADFFPEKKHFRKVNLSFSSSRFQKADDLKGRRRRRRRRRKRTPTLTETRQQYQSVAEKQVLS